MSRIRTYKPDFWASEQIMDVSRDARLLFLGMWNFCDDGGVHPASARRLKAQVFPGDDDATTDQVAIWMAELIGVGLVAEFDAEGRRWWHVTGWNRHQKIDRPTFRHPSPPLDQDQKFVEDSTSIRRGFDEHSSSPRVCLATEGKGREGKGRDKNLVNEREVVVQAESLVKNSPILDPATGGDHNLGRDAEASPTAPTDSDFSGHGSPLSPSHDKNIDPDSLDLASLALDDHSQYHPSGSFDCVDSRAIAGDSDQIVVDGHLAGESPMASLDSATGKGGKNGKAKNGKHHPSVTVPKVIDLYHAILPELPACMVPVAERERLIRARMDSLPTEGQWRDYFTYVHDCPFLMGRVKPSDETRRPFRADLMWLVRPSNFDKVMAGRYQDARS